MATNALVLHDVNVLHATNLGWLCRVGDAQVFIARLEVDPDVVMPAEGERGTVIVQAYAAERVRKFLRA